MMILLQVTGSPGQANILDKIPTFEALIQTYGPFLGLIIILVTIILVLQYHWFSRALKAKNEEIKRLVEREKELYIRLTNKLDNAVKQL